MLSRNRIPWPLALAGALPLAAGCGDPIIGDEILNAAPETVVTAAPPHTEPTGSEVSFFWDGHDPDGRIVGFEWRISDNGPDGVVDPADTLEVHLPWRFTHAADSTFFVSAELPGYAEDVADSVRAESVRSWQSHTFFVRSVDEDGAVDPTPAMTSFTATTLTPNVKVTIPRSVQLLECTAAPPGLAFAWDATDADTGTGTPESIRYMLKRYAGPGEPCLKQFEFEAGRFPIVADDPAWSEWIPYDAPLDSGRVVRYPVRPPSEVGTSYVFAVQARDEAGAVTPTFVWGRNVRHVIITDSHAPVLTVSEPLLGSNDFVRLTTSRTHTLASSQVVAFEWHATAADYGNLIEGYRYGFNITDPDNPDDPGWAVPWGLGPAWKRATPRTLPPGSPNFIVQAVDTSNQMSRATYHFQVIQVPRRSEQRRLLLVDDTHKEPLAAPSVTVDRSWDLRWRRLIEGIGVVGFGAGDVVDAVDEPERLNFALAVQYRGIIWHLGPGKSFYRSEIAPPSRNFDWLNAYQREVGNVLFTGSGAMGSTISNRFPEYPIVWNSGANQSATAIVPWDTWCLAAIDQVRPDQIYAEVPGNLSRETKCSAIVYAVPAAEMFAEYQITPTEIPPLVPNRLRRFGRLRYYSGPGGLDPTELNITALDKEEFYNVNVSTRPVAVTLRDCQVPMFRAIARRDVDEPSIFASPVAQGWADMGLGVEEAIVDSILLELANPPIWVDNCASQLGRGGTETSPVSLQPIAIASSTYSGRSGLPATKQNGTLLASDFLWGFHPLHFETLDVRAALRWIVLDHWGVNQDF